MNKFTKFLTIVFTILFCSVVMFGLNAPLIKVGFCLFTMPFVYKTTAGVGEFVRLNFAPEYIIYRRTSDRIGTTIYWNGGIHLVNFCIISWFGLAAISQLEWGFLIGISIASIITSFIAGAIGFPKNTEIC